MTQKLADDFVLERRKPRQARSQHKVELMLEAAMRLLAESDVGALTTNAVAAKAGVSIGTLYQYFAHRDAIIDALYRFFGQVVQKGRAGKPNGSVGAARPCLTHPTDFPASSAA